MCALFGCVLARHAELRDLKRGQEASSGLLLSPDPRDRRGVEHVYRAGETGGVVSRGRASSVADDQLWMASRAADEEEPQCGP